MGSRLPDDPPLYEPGAPDLDAPGESLKSFKSRVDRLLMTLDGSSAAHGRITEQKVAAAAYGTRFVEAMALSTTYALVHLRLTELSRTLGEQLEAMGITVDLADRDYEDVDQEYANRLRAIQKRLEDGYKGPDAGPDADTHTGAPKGDPAKGGWASGERNSY
ncbi:hypothetical protein [Streptomyces sp. SID9727]|uniref:hypothetical protein n=1 Tax=Streptomyces sp. SID9727 TaxID=2706114 RepID=UPI0013C641F8|nr:hypothetical protein [Streptomyces sp. SID9727]NEC68517.1 hypothetical protein [Streptomyces sp. SID9727]